MKHTRIAAILMLAFLFGGSSAEVAVQAKRALDRHRAVQEEGAAGELVAFELRRDDGELVARPRLIAPPGRAAELVLRDPEHPAWVRVALRVSATREASGDLSIEYELRLPGDDLSWTGRISVTPGVETALGAGDGSVSGTVFTVPVPSAAFDAYLDSERVLTGSREAPRM